MTRGYRLLLASAGAANLADGIAALAFPWLATLITRDPQAVAAVAFASRLPWFLFAIPAGVLADRLDRRRLILLSDLFRAAALGAAALLATWGDAPVVAAVALLAGLAFLSGSAEVVRDNTAQTIMPALVPPSRLEAANGRLWSVEQVMGAFVGPPLAGVLFALSVSAPFTAAAAGYAVAAVLIWRLTLPHRPPAAPRHPVAEARDGWAFLRSHPMLLRLAVILGLINALSLLAFTVLVLFSQEVLGLSAAAHGALLTAGAAGGVAGGLAAPLVVKRFGPQVTLNLALACIPLPLMLLALSSTPLIAAAALFFETFVALLWNVVTVSYRQRIIPDALLGRVNSLYRFFGWGMMPLGALAAGWVVTWAEPSLGRDAALRLPILLAAGGLAAVAVYGRLRLKL